MTTQKQRISKFLHDQVSTLTLRSYVLLVSTVVFFGSSISGNFVAGMIEEDEPFKNLNRWFVRNGLDGIIVILYFGLGGIMCLSAIVLFGSVCWCVLSWIKGFLIKQRQNIG
jgi:hypothetical protein